MRELLVTPWFAAGVGIVIAAMLALATPRHAVLSYGPLDPGVPCQNSRCATVVPAHGSLASARPGVQLELPEIRRAPAVPDAAGQPGARPRPARPARPARSARSARSARPASARSASSAGATVHYAVLPQGNGTFLAVITVRSSKKLGNWSLEFVIPGARISDVWGARWQPSARGDGGVASGHPWPWTRSGPGMAKIVIFATGKPRPPASCTFDGGSCVLS
jgi:hypothetical protein